MALGKQIVKQFISKNNLEYAMCTTLIIHFVCPPPPPPPSSPPAKFCITFDVMLSSLNQPSLKALGESMSSLGLTGNSLLNKQNVMKDSFIKYLRVSYI